MSSIQKSLDQCFGGTCQYGCAAALTVVPEEVVRTSSNRSDLVFGKNFCREIAFIEPFLCIKHECAP